MSKTSTKLFVGVAPGCMRRSPPKWIQEEITGEDAALIGAACGARRKRELYYSRGLKHALYKNIAEFHERDRDAVNISFSHDRQCVAVALTQSGEIGVDVQTDRALDSCTRIADTWFPVAEAREIRAAQDCRRFLISWTIKEAWAKCFRRTVFDALKSVVVSAQMVHLKAPLDIAPRFAWTRVMLQREPENPQSRQMPTVCTMGICWVGDGVPQVRCFALSEELLEPIALDWKWIPTVCPNGTQQ